MPQDFHQDIVQTTPDGIWVVDLDGHTLFANPAMADLVGCTLHEMSSLTMLDTLDGAGGAHFRQRLAAAREGRLEQGEVECRLVRRDNHLLWVRVSEQAITGPDGTTPALVHRFHDITEQRRVVHELRHSQAKLLEAEQVARLGSWELDLDTEALSVSPGFARLIGHDPERIKDLGDLEERMHPDDREKLLADLVTATKSDSFVTRLRVTDRQGGWVTLHITTARHLDAEGRPQRLAGTAIDISETVATEAALKERIAENTLMETVAKAANEARHLVDQLREAVLMPRMLPHWRRGRGFAVTSRRAVPLFLDDADEEACRRSPEELRHDTDLATRAVIERTAVWDGSSIACPVLLAGVPKGVFVITADWDEHRLPRIEELMTQGASQLARVAEREQSDQALAVARDEAMAASRQKSEFLAMVSHEIRTPLNGVIGLNDLLLRTDLGAEQRRLATGIELSGRALIRLINDVLDYSKIEAGRLGLERVDFDLRAIVSQATEPHAAAARAKGLHLDVDIDDALPATVNSDPTRYSQVLGNLLSNAVKFTAEGRVDVRLEVVAGPEGSLLRTEVRDTGIGIEADHNTLFEPFRQGDESTTRIYGGTGLGLAICRELATALGGEIDLESTPGSGTRMWFTVRLEELTGGPTLGVETDKTHDPRAAQVDGRAARVLVVEDHPVNQMVAVGMLEALGYDVEIVDDGRAGLALLRREQFDLVLMDIHMPGLDGYATTRRIRAEEGDGRRIPVIAMTASVVDNERNRCAEAGMDAVLTKPVDPRQLARTLAAWIGGGDGASEDEATALDRPVVVAPATDREGVDVARLDMLRDMDDTSTTYLDRAIGNFTSGAEEHLRGIREAVETDDPGQLRFRAHRLAGSAGNLGLPVVCDTAQALELLADGDTTDGAADLLPDLEQAIRHGRQALLDYQAAYTADRS